MTDATFTIPARARTQSVSGRAPARRKPAMRHSLADHAVRMLSRAARRPGRTLVWIGLCGVGAAIMINAVALQTARHPAPFGSDLARGELARLAQEPPLPPTRPVVRESATARTASGPAVLPPANVQPAPVPPVAAARPAPAVAAPAQPAPSRDPIADLIRNGMVPPAEVGKSEPRNGEPQKPVLAAQKALAKLGYGPVRTDGVFGEATRAALEKFERERRLPVTRDLTPRTLRELSSASGLRIE